MGSQLRVWEPALGSRLNEGGSYPDLREKRKSGKEGKAEPRDMRVLGIPSQGIFGFWESQAKGYAGFGNPKPRDMWGLGIPSQVIYGPVNPSQVICGVWRGQAK